MGLVGSFGSDGDALHQQAARPAITADGDVPAATAILDRFLAHAVLVQMSGKSYRLRQRASTPDD